MKKVFALRAASQCLNTKEDIVLRISSLYDNLLQNNKLQESDIISLIFSVSDDLDALNPAAGLRQSGRGLDLSLFTVREPEYKNSLPRTIRFLMHCYLEDDAIPCHVYQNGAEVLRPDRVKK
ncbi:MAG: chorismate mutase [Spirochaetaceae bacterium]|jgi:chorismate mutase|nr:chorismate mutase [Spirochaetaceae bacterium]